LSASPDECLHRALVKDTRDHVVFNRTTDEELHVSVRSCDKCGRMSQESATEIVPMMVEGMFILGVTMFDGMWLCA